MSLDSTTVAPTPTDPAHVPALWDTGRADIGQHEVIESRPFQNLPSRYWQVPYVGARFPGAASRDELELGANCQLWAYAVLRHFSFDPSDFRSDDVWYDSTATRRVYDPRPLDLVLFNSDGDPYRAHVGLWTGDAVAHLCREVGRPVVWAQSLFYARTRYSVRIGFKRPIARAPSRRNDVTGPGL
jgi:hypothetical protein